MTDDIKELLEKAKNLIEEAKYQKALENIEKHRLR